MITSHTPNPARLDARVFVIGGWILGIMALGQVWIAALALAERHQLAARPQIIEKETIRHVVVRVPSATPEEVAASAVVSRPPVPAVIAPVAPATFEARSEVVPTPKPRPLEAPIIADPRCERLVTEAREARVAGDMMRAVMKLEEALVAVPQEAAVLYEMGLIHEQMGIFDKASDFYQKVFELGVSGAGAYYPSAAAKLRDGFETPADLIGRLSLGRVRIFQPPDKTQGETVLLTIPVQKAPTFEVDANEIEVSVVFFNRTLKGDIIQLDEPSWVRQQWVSLPFDWSAGEELLRMTYTIPPQDQQSEHLFGMRKYYGQVVTLRHKGEILDVQAWPRDLAGRLPAPPVHAGQNQLSPDFLDTPPPDFDPDLGVLPLPLPE